MNPVTTALTLNMQLPNIATVSWAVQGDMLSRQIIATLVDGSIAWNPQAGYHGVVRYHKPDGTSGVYDVDEDGNPAVTWTGNVATVKIVQQALTVPGTVLMQLEFYDVNEARVSAFGWANNVQPSAVTDNEFLSSDYYNILTLQIAGVLGADGHPPYIDSTTKNWMIWDTNTQGYIDSGFSSVGLPPDLQSTTYEYANSASGTVVPSTWSPTRPAPVQGKYSWTKVTVTWETGTSVYYTVAYQGIDGTSSADIKQMIAQEETSTTSAHAYAIGDYFILNDTLYVATAAIGIGDTIAAGTNCQQATVGPDLASIRTALNHTNEALAILADGDTHAAINVGQYVFVINHSTLSEGLYINDSGSNIAANAALSSNNLTAVSGGGLNDIKKLFPISNIGQINRSTAATSHTITFARGQYFLIISSANTQGMYVGYVLVDSSGGFTFLDILKGSDTTLSGSSYVLTVAFSSSRSIRVTYISISGGSIT